MVKGGGNKSNGGAAKVKTKAALAKALGVSTTTIGNWSLAEDCPIHGHGPYDVEEVRHWRASLQVDRTDPGRFDRKEPTPGEQLELSDEAKLAELSVAGRAEVELKRERRRKVRQEIEIAAGKYVLRTESDAHMGALVDLFVRQLEEMVQSLPAQLQGLDAPAVERVLDDRVAGIRNGLAAQMVAGSFGDDDGNCA